MTDILLICVRGIMEHPVLAIPIIGTIIMICRACGKEGEHIITRSSKYHKDYRCPNCNVISSKKTKG